MSIWDRDYYAEHTLRKMGILEDREKLRRNDAGPFNINLRHRQQERRDAGFAWSRFVLLVLVAAGVAAGLFVLLVKTIGSR